MNPDMDPSFKKPLPRSKTPPLNRNPGNPIFRTLPRQLNNRNEVSTVSASSLSARLPSRITRSENDLSIQRRQMKSKETLSKQDQLALSYNAYLQSYLMKMHDTKIRNEKEQEIVTIMENQQLELITLDEENNYLEEVLMKIKLFKKMKKDLEKKSELCEQIIQSTNEEELDNQIRTIENNIKEKLLKNFKLPETDKEKTIVLDLLTKIAQELSVIPEVKNMVKPLNDLCRSLLKAKELNAKTDELKKQCTNKLRKAEELMYDEFYLRTKIGTLENPSEFELIENQFSEEGAGDGNPVDILSL